MTTRRLDRTRSRAVATLLEACEQRTMMDGSFQYTGGLASLPSDRLAASGLNSAPIVIDDINGDGEFNLKDVAEELKANKVNKWAPLEEDGDFRSPECIKLLEQADIVVTNPPFSLFREYVKQLVDHKKRFAVIGNMNAITYKEIFPLIKDNEVWLGATGNGNDMVFAVPNGVQIAESDRQKAARLGYVGDFTRLGNSCWFTNLDHGRRHRPLQLMTMAENLKFSPHKQIKGKKNYEKYDNYDAIEVPFTDAIPSDYKGAMGVPISFLSKYNPDQFEILGVTQRNDDPFKKKRYSTDQYPNANDLNARAAIIRNGMPQAIYARILIRQAGQAK
jgi:hypothetical protein